MKPRQDEHHDEAAPESLEDKLTWGLPYAEANIAWIEGAHERGVYSFIEDIRRQTSRVSGGESWIEDAGLQAANSEALETLANNISGFYYLADYLVGKKDLDPRYAEAAHYAAEVKQLVDVKYHSARSFGEKFDVAFQIAIGPGKRLVEAVKKLLPPAQDQGRAAA